MKPQQTTKLSELNPNDWITYGHGYACVEELIKNVYEGKRKRECYHCDSGSLIQIDVVKSDTEKYFACPVCEKKVVDTVDSGNCCGDSDYEIRHRIKPEFYERKGE